MAVDAFLKMKIEGESQVKGHEKEIQVLSWQWGVSQSGTLHMGSGGGAGKANVTDLVITKYVDSASPTLALACCNGEHFDEAILTMRKAGKEPLDYMSFKMEKVMITAVSVSGSAGSEQLMETISLNFAKFTESYQPQDDKGAKKGGAIEVTYDIAANA